MKTKLSSDAECWWRRWWQINVIIWFINVADPRESARDARLPFPVDPIYLIFMQFLGKFWRPTCRVCPSIWEIVDPLLRKDWGKKRHTEFTGYPDVCCSVCCGKICDGDQWATDESKFKIIFVYFLRSVHTVWLRMRFFAAINGLYWIQCECSHCTAVAVSS